MTKFYESSLIGGTVNRELGIIPNVKVIGRVSKNGREYSERALNEAAAKYERIDVNVNHPDRNKPNTERRIEDGFGWLESCVVKPDGVYADLHYLKEHPQSGLIVEAAERMSNRFGLSHNAEGTVKRINGKNVVESIERVLSVDLVQHPATTNGLFESESRTIREVLEQSAPDLLVTLTEDGALLPPEVMDEPAMPGGDGADAAGTVKAACAQILTAMLDLPGDVASMCTQLIAVCQKVISGQPEPNQDAENPAEEADPSEEPDPNDPNSANQADPGAGGSANDNPNPFQKRKNNMAESELTLPARERKELDELREEVRQLREKIAHGDLREQCDALLRAKFRESSPAIVTALANMPTEEARLQLIEELPSIKQPDTPYRPRRPDFTSPPANRDENAIYPSSVKDLVEACR